jgi:hypothetical protein
MRRLTLVLAAALVAAPVAPASVFMTPNPDGSLTVAAHGRNLFYTVDPEPFTVFHRGRAVLTASVSGEWDVVLVEPPWSRPSRSAHAAPASGSAAISYVSRSLPAARGER